MHFGSSVASAGPMPSISAAPKVSRHDPELETVGRPFHGRRVTPESNAEPGGQVEGR